MTKRREFGQYLRSIRMEKGLTLMKTSERLGYKSIGTMNNVEQGLTPLPIDKIHTLAELYGMDLEELLLKIEECEPDLYRRYRTLAGQIIGHFTAKVAGLHKVSYGTTGEARAKPHFKVDPNIHYTNLSKYKHLDVNRYFLALTNFLKTGSNRQFMETGDRHLSDGFESEADHDLYPVGTGRVCH